MNAVMQTIARMRPAGPCPDCRLDPPSCEPGAANATFCPREDAGEARQDQIETKEDVRR